MEDMRRMGKTIYFSDKQLEVLFELVTMNIGTGYHLDVGEILDQLVSKIPYPKVRTLDWGEYENVAKNFGRKKIFFGIWM